MLEPAEPLLRGGSGEITVLQNCGCAIMAHSVERKQVEREILECSRQTMSAR